MNRHLNFRKQMPRREQTYASRVLVSHWRIQIQRRLSSRCRRMLNVSPPPPHRIIHCSAHQTFVPEPNNRRKLPHSTPPVLQPCLKILRGCVPGFDNEDQITIIIFVAYTISRLMFWYVFWYVPPQSPWITAITGCHVTTYRLSTMHGLYVGQFFTKWLHKNKLYRALC